MAMNLELLRALAERAQRASSYMEATDPNRRKANASPYAHLIPSNTPAVGDAQNALDATRRGEGLATLGIDTGRIQSWMHPLEGPSRAVGAAIEGENPFEAARDPGMTAPNTAEVLTERGMNPILATVIDAAVTPDPIGAGRAADLVPLMGLLGPAGLKMLLRNANDVEFMPASILRDARGNELRRSPATQSAFRREIMDSGGLNEPVIVMYDPKTMRFKTGEGNHRVFAAMEADSPVPVRVVEGRVASNEGMELPPEGQEALQSLADARHGYSPGTARPSEVGLPVYGTETVLDYARQLGEDRLMPFTDADVSEIQSALRSAASAEGVLPRSRRVVTRPARANPDFTPTIARAAREAGFDGTAEDWVVSVYRQLGHDRAGEYLQDVTGLREHELAETINRWTDTRRTRPLEVESDIQNMLGVGMQDRLADLTEQIEEFQAVLDSGILTGRTSAEAERLYYEVSSVIDDLAPIVGVNDEAREVTDYLEGVRRGIQNNMELDPVDVPVATLDQVMKELTGTRGEADRLLDELYEVYRGHRSIDDTISPDDLAKADRAVMELEVSIDTLEAMTRDFAPDVPPEIRDQVRARLEELVSARDQIRNLFGL